MGVIIISHVTDQKTEEQTSSVTQFHATVVKGIRMFSKNQKFIF